eukprot:10441894-Prorocentrum_lima.AAC.1
MSPHLVRVMLGGVKVRTEAEKSTRVSRDVTARFHPAHTPTTSAIISNPAQVGTGHMQQVLD